MHLISSNLRLGASISFDDRHVYSRSPDIVAAFKGSTKTRRETETDRNAERQSNTEKDATTSNPLTDDITRVRTLACYQRVCRQLRGADHFGAIKWRPLIGKRFIGCNKRPTICCTLCGYQTLLHNTSPERPRVVQQGMECVGGLCRSLTSVTNYHRRRVFVTRLAECGGWKNVRKKWMAGRKNGVRSWSKTRFSAWIQESSAGKSS